jgi:hypothetical protein
VNPVREEVSVFRSPFAPRVLAGTDVLDGEDVLPGFSVTIAEIFETSLTDCGSCQFNSTPKSC